ncbi:hypothetical protein Pmani_015495 [Petrolisthes manimaculis]|uniref:Uncharacterized protein n=1 Tax=Petrolisthes manimaculis TaxID=1843537 RepID=A0AAE1UBI7_9EUCA|nr:hypothetical protein Pmani_015495 [Petrolisthes manimaculis]
MSTTTLASGVSGEAIQSPNSCSSSSTDSLSQTTVLRIYTDGDVEVEESDEDDEKEDVVHDIEYKGIEEEEEGNKRRNTKRWKDVGVGKPPIKFYIEEPPGYGRDSDEDVYESHENGCENVHGGCDNDSYQEENKVEEGDEVGLEGDNREQDQNHFRDTFDMRLPRMSYFSRQVSESVLLGRSATFDDTLERRVSQPAYLGSIRTHDELGRSASQDGSFGRRLSLSQDILAGRRISHDAISRMSQGSTSSSRGRERRSSYQPLRRLSDLRTLTMTLGLHIHGSILNLATDKSRKQVSTVHWRRW